VALSSDAHGTLPHSEVPFSLPSQKVESDDMQSDLTAPPGKLHRWGRARRRLDEPSRFDSEAQTAASEETVRRESRRAREMTRASEGERDEPRRMEENNWMIHSRLQGEVFIQNSYIVEDTKLKNKQEEQRNKRIIENANRGRIERSRVKSERERGRENGGAQTCSCRRIWSYL
jgi:hypothetical protein